MEKGIYSKGGEVKDLIVLHNINEYQIKEANKLGGLVTPSIAILKSGNAFTDFGSITLIATKELIDPKNGDVKVFAGDVYSPSVPRKLWHVDKRLLDRVTTQLIKESYQYDQNISSSKGEIYHLVSSTIADYSDFQKDISRSSLDELIKYYEDKLKLVYLVDKGIKIKVPMREKRHFLFNNLEFTLTNEQKKRFAPILRAYTEESNEKGSGGVSKETMSKVYDLFLEVLDGVKKNMISEKDEEMASYLADSLTNSFEKYVGTRYDWSGRSEDNLSRAVFGEQELDKEKLAQNINKVIKPINEDYKKWLSNFLSQFRGSAYFLKGNSKEPYTLDNLVDATSNKVVGQEKNMTFGVNQAKSFATKRFNSIEDIKKSSDKIITKEEMNLVDEQNKEGFFKLAEALKYDYDGWGKFDSLGKALADYFKGASVATALRKNDFQSPTPSQEYLFKEFADELKKSPVDYFEAKYQRAVSLKEFKYAIVPKTTSKEVVQILNDNGLSVKKYDNEVQRLDLINKISNKDKSIKFNHGGKMEQEIYAKGGKIIAYKNESPKFKKIGIEDKYTIEAITEIGLQGFNFDKQSVEDKITDSFNDLLRNSFSDEYIISEDSQAITKQIENEIETRYNQGDTEDNIARYRMMLDNPRDRKRYIDDYAKTQKETIGEWVNYLKISEYGVPIKFLILKAVLNFNYDYKTNDLVKRNKKTIRNFTPFDAGALAELVANDSDNLLQDYTNIQAENAIKVVKSKELIKTSEGGRWIKFDGGKSTSEDVRKQNAKELSKLVQNTYWCTKTNADNQLKDGDFYVYVTESDGEVFPRIAIRMEGVEVGEVRGNKSAKQDLEDEMIPIAKEFLEKNIPNDSGKKWLDSLEYNTKAINLLQSILEKGLFKNSIEEFLELRSQEQKYLVDYASSNGNIDRLDSLVKKLVKELPNANYSEKEVVLDISDFDEKKTRILLGSVNFRFNTWVVDLGNLEIIGGDADFGKVGFPNLGRLKKIFGDADFSGSSIESLQNIENIGGNLILNNSNIEDLGKLTTIGGEVDFNPSHVKSLNRLTTIGSHAYLTNIEDLGDLKTIGGDAYFNKSEVENLKNLTQIGGRASFFYSKIKNLGKLKTIGRDANFQGTKIKDLGNIETIGGTILLQGSEVEDLGKLKYVRGLILQNTKVKTLGELKTIDGNANFDDSMLEDLGHITKIGGYARFFKSQVKSLGNLQTIGGALVLTNSQITSLDNLISIGSDADFNDSMLEDLGNLKIIEGNVFLRSSKVKSLGSLTKIGGSFHPSAIIEDLGNLTNIGGDVRFQGTLIEDLGKLKGIGGNANFGSKKLKSLGSLTAIGGYADFEFSHIKSLDNLYYVGSDVLLERSEIVDFGNLTIVGGEVVFGENQDMLKKQWDYQERINRLKSQLENSRLPKELREKIEDELFGYEEAKKEIQNNSKLLNNEGDMEQKLYARGGKIIVEKNDLQKFGKIGITNKYDIEAIKDIGLQGLPFTQEAILKKIQDEFDVLTETNRKVEDEFDVLNVSFRDYIVSEDSDAITNTIENTIATLKRDGKSQDEINIYTKALTNPFDRQRYIDDFAQNQLEAISKWVSYLKQSSYITSFKYLLLKAVLKFNYDYKLDKLIERNNKTIRNFTPFDASIIGQLVIDESDFLLKDYTTIQVKNSLSIVNSKETIKKSGNGRWVKFDGGSGVDEEIIEKNANELSQLVQNTYWCTKTNAYSQLEDGDFYVYVTEKDNELFPRIAIRMEGDNVGEVRGNKSSAQDIEEEMLPIAEDFLINNIPNNSGKEWLDSIAYNQKVVDFTNKIVQDGLSKGDLSIYLDLFKDEEKFTTDYGGRNSNIDKLTGTIKDLIENEKFNKDFEYKKDEFDLYGGNYSDIEATKKYKVCFTNVENYSEDNYPNLEIVIGNLRSFKNNLYDISIKGFGKIRYVGGWLNYDYKAYKIETLGNIEFIGGGLFFNENLKDFGNLEYCGGDITISGDFSIKSFGKLKSVGGDLTIKRLSQIEDLGLLENVDALYIESPKIKSLGKIKKLNELYLGIDSNIQDLGSLEEVNGRLDIDGSKSLKSLGKLKKVDDLVIEESQIEDLGELEVITGDLYLNKKVKSLGKLKSVGDLNLQESTIDDLGNIEKVNNLYLEGNKKIKSLGKLKRIEYDVAFNETLEDLANLEYIGGDANFRNCKKIKSLKKLKIIGGDLNPYGSSSLEDLGNLESIGGSIDFYETKIQTLGNLKKIGGNCMLNKSIKSLGKLEYVDGDLDLSESLVENLGNLQKVRNLSLNKKVKDLGKIVELRDLTIYNEIDFKGLKLIKSLDCNGFESEKPIEITLPKVDSIKELTLFNVNVDEISIKQIDNLYITRSKVNVLKDIDELRRLEISESTINNIKNVNLNDTSIKYEDSDETKKLISAYKRGEKKQKDTKLEKIKKYENLIENLEKVLSDKSLNDDEKKEIREAINTYEDMVADVRSEIRFEDGGLVAPNGKKSNLTPEQYKLVRTPVFKAWFGDWENDPKNASKVVDINGEPLVVYRGDSSGKFVFENSNFFSSNDYVAGSYSNVDAIPEYEVFLNIRKPLDLLGGNELRLNPNSSRISGSDPNVVDIFKNAINELPENYKVMVGWGDEWDKETLYNAVIKNYYDIDYINYDNQSASWEAIINYAKRDGFDGVFMLDESFDKLIRFQFSQITFYPEQIKLADGTNKTFDSNNPDIRFDDGGNIFKNGGNMKKVDSGGITYGASHDNGGIPVKNASTGEMLEVEGGEGIVNKRSMASDKMVKLNGKDMSICEAVSKLNEMEGGVKFSCEDVEHSQFIEEMALGGELERGTRTEKEHIKVLQDLYAQRITPKQATEKIAKDHIKENPNYYTELAKIEKKMANGGKSSCGCSHHSTQYKYGGKTNCGCNTKKYDNGGMTSDTDRLLDKLKALKKPKDDKEDLINQTLSDARMLLDIDYKEELKSLPPNIYDLIKDVPSFNLYNLGWRCHFTTHKTWAGVCVNDDYDENKISLGKNNIYLSIDFVRNEKNWDKRYKDVVLHEIAHAIVSAYFVERLGNQRFSEIDPMHYSTQGHGMIWKAVCSAINPSGDCDQFYRNAILAEEHKNYVYVCANCGNKKYGNSPTFAKVCNKCYKSIFVEKNNE